MLVNGVNRAVPVGPVTAYKTYRYAQPLATHWRPATCEEVDCWAWRKGWSLHVESLPPALVHTARASGRRFREVQFGPGQTWLQFEAGQPCFHASRHMLPVGRPPLLVVRDGDWRGNPTGRTRQHTRMSYFVEDWAENQSRLRDQQQQKG